MKHTIIMTIFFFVIIKVQSQTTPVPDPVFENKLISLGIDSNGLTGNILNADAEGVINLNVTNSSIEDLSGIEAFVDLEMLDCDTNLLTNLDLSSNTKLKFVDCQKNLLQSLNVSGNEDLQSLACQENQLINLNLSNNLLLSDLSCQDNLLTNLDLSNNIELFQIICHDNSLTNITFPTTQSKLQIFWCYNNQLESIDLTTAPVLATLRFENNNLNFLDLRNGNNTAIHTMDARDNANLALICVDDVTYSSTAFNWNKDDEAEYSETCTLSITDLEKSRVHIYPNPVNDFLTLDMLGEPLREVKIYNHLGRLKAVKTSSSMDFTTYIPGVYILGIETQSGAKIVRKIIKL